MIGNWFSMPKVVLPVSLISEFGGKAIWEYNPATKSLFCKLCITSCPAGRRNMIEKHVNTMRPKKKIDLRQQGTSGTTTQPSFVQVVSESSSKTSVFVSDLAKMLVACDIPLKKVEQPLFQEFIHKYCKETIPSRNTLTRVMEQESKAVTDKITEKLTGQDIFVKVPRPKKAFSIFATARQVRHSTSCKIEILKFNFH